MIGHPPRGNVAPPILVRRLRPGAGASALGFGRCLAGSAQNLKQPGNWAAKLALGEQNTTETVRNTVPPPNWSTSWHAFSAATEALCTGKFPWVWAPRGSVKLMRLGAPPLRHAACRSLATRAVAPTSICFQVGHFFLGGGGTPIGSGSWPHWRRGRIRPKKDVARQRRRPTRLDATETCRPVPARGQSWTISSWTKPFSAF